MASATPIDGRCAAKVGTGYCEKHPMTGQLRCGTHGGRAPQAIAAATRRQQEARAAVLATTYGLPVEIDPVDALLGELWRTQGAVLWLEAQIRALEPAALTWGVTEVAQVHASQFAGTNRTEAAGITPLLEVYLRERKHLAQLSKDCVTVGIELRMEQRIKTIGQDFHDLVTRVVTALGHDVADPDVSRLIVASLREPAEVAA